MTWTKKYWDAVHDFYWVPQYLGLASIPGDQVIKGDSTVTIPKKFINPTGPLYRRTKSGNAYWAYVRRQEETFNHIWNITLDVMPGDVAAELLNPFVGWTGSNWYRSHSGVIGDRYPELSGPNVTTPDCLLVSDDRLLAVELKFNAKTSLDQIAKYLSILVAEERLNGIREQVGLLYIYPADAQRRFQKETGESPESIKASAFDKILSGTKHLTVRKFMENNRTDFESALDRLTVSYVIWSDVSARIAAYVRNLGSGKGDRTLARLLEGLDREIQKHPHSKCAPSGAD